MLRRHILYHSNSSRMLVHVISSDSFTTLSLEFHIDRLSPKEGSKFEDTLIEIEPITKIRYELRKPNKQISIQEKSSHKQQILRL